MLLINWCLWRTECWSDMKLKMSYHWVRVLRESWQLCYLAQHILKLYLFFPLCTLNALLPRLVAGIAEKLNQVSKTDFSLAVIRAALFFLNSRHSNIKFTTELESNNKLPFLDVYVVRRVNKYITTVYRKKTFTGVYLNWNSLTSRKYKIGLINNLLNRIFRSCTRVEDRNK